ncbi:MAG: CHASE4 domain-containing protein [Clostridium sp.]|nr:CHASE4 domain-containing protein [Clostridium sp.]
MSIKLKALLISFISFLFVTAFTFIMFDFSIFNYSHKMETNTFNKNYGSFNQIINHETNGLKQTSSDWSIWDSTYNFILSSNQQYIDDNLGKGTLNQLNLNFMFFLNKNNNLINSTTNLDTTIKNNLLNNFYTNKNFFKNNNTNIVNVGILKIKGKIFLIAVSPITTSNGKAKSVGNLIIGRYIDKSLISYMNSITQSNFEIKGIDSSYNNKTTKGKNFVTEYRTIKDINGNMSLIVSNTISTNGYTLENTYLRNFIIIFSLLLTIFFITILLILNKLILKPINSMNTFVHNLSKTGSLKNRIEVTGNDELSNLAKSTNKFLSLLDFQHKDMLNSNYYDNLTVLKNKFYIEKELNKLDKKKNIIYDLLFVDIDGLKYVNIAFNRKKGNLLICKTSNILSDSCAEDDIAARIIGGQFIIITIEKDKEYLLNLINTIKSSYLKITDFNFDISLSFGSARRENCETSDLIINAAEQRLYREKLVKVNSSKNATLISLLKTLYEKHSDTEAHTERVKKLSTALGKSLNLSNDKLYELELLSSLHDIGKIGIPDTILSKPGKLNDEEWKMMKQHTEIGYRIAMATPELRYIANEILCHHEKFDGTGYPNGLKGNEIPILSRIINVMDSFDVMTHKRAYKDAMNLDYAINELKRCSGTQFDPKIVNAFLKILKNDEDI